MNLQKHKTVKNPKLLNEMKEEIGHDEYDPAAYGPLEAHHIVPKGMGGCNGPDIRENIIILTGPARYGLGNHGAAHKGLIPAEVFWRIVAKREEITVNECKTRVRRAMGYDV